MKVRGTVAWVVLTVVAAVTFAAAADLEKSVASAHGRRKAAENGLREIKAKSAQDGEQIRALYSEAATRNNAWLDAVCQAIESGAAAAPALQAVVEPAASSLVAWVDARNRALGVAALTTPVADAVKRDVARELTEIANVSWRNSRNADQEKRTKTIAALKERLQWRTWEEIR